MEASQPGYPGWLALRDEFLTGCSPVGGANLFTSLTAFIFPPRPKLCFSEHVFNLKLTHEQTQLPK